MGELTMADRIGADGSRHEASMVWGGDATERLIDWVSESTVLRIDNVAEYVESQRNVDRASTLKGMSGVRLPWERALFEFKPTARDNLNDIRAIGVFFFNMSVESGERIIANLMRGGEWKDAHPSGEIESAVAVLFGQSIVESKDGTFTWLPCLHASWVDADGTVLSYRSLVHPNYGGKSACDEFITMFAAGAMAISFLNCRNVRRIEHQPRPKLSKRCAAIYGRPAVKFYTLEIEPMKRVLETEGDVAHNGIAKALHICRGHFADYRNGNGLFGRNKGLFWFDAHVRGTAERGVVLKDYSVKAPVAPEV